MIPQDFPSCYYSSMRNLAVLVIHLIVPYGVADHATGFATVPLDEVLAAMNYEDRSTA